MAEVPVLPGANTRRELLPRRDYEQAALRTMLAVLLLVGLAAYALAVWFDWLPWLRGWGNFPQGWTWRTYPEPPLERFLPVALPTAGIWAVVVLAELGYGAPWLPYARVGNRTVKALFLVLMVLMGYALQLGLLGLKADNPQRLLVERETNRVFAGYFNLAASTGSIDTFFASYPAVFDTKICPHCHNHPPGPSLYYWLNIQAAELLPSDWRHNLANQTWGLLGNDASMVQLRNTLDDAQALGAFAGGTLLLLLAAAVVVPLYGLARLLGPPGFEFRLAALGLALPGLMLMVPEFDQVYATLAAAALYMCLRGLLAGGALDAGLWGAAAGLAVALGLFFSWGLAALLVVLALLALACLAGSRRMLTSIDLERPRISLGELFAWAAGLAVGVVGTLAALVLLAHVDLPYILQYNLQNAALAEAGRPYAVWLLFGPLDFVQFLGLPLALAVVLSLVLKPWQTQWSVVGGQWPVVGGQWPVVSGPQVERESPASAREQILPTDHRPLPTDHWYARVNVYALALVLVVGGLDLAGRSKAEQGRLLIFLMPLALAAVYLWMGRSRPRPALVSQLFFAQMLVLVVIGARWFVP